MTTGIAPFTSVDLDWIVRVLQSAGYPDATISEDEDVVVLISRSLRIAIWRDEDRALMRCNCVFTGKTELSGDLVTRTRVIRRIQENLRVTRVAWYGKQESIELEFDVPILVGLSRAQLLAVVRAVVSDADIAAALLRTVG